MLSGSNLLGDMSEAGNGSWVTEHMQEVLDFAFQYIELLQQEGVVEWLYKEVLLVLYSLIQGPYIE